MVAMNTLSRHMGDAGMDVRRRQGEASPMYARRAFLVLSGDRWEEAQDVFHAALETVRIQAFEPHRTRGRCRR